MDDTRRLAEVLKAERSALLKSWRAGVRGLPSAEHLDVPTLNDHIPVLLDELEQALRDPESVTIADAVTMGSSPYHGLQRLHDGFEIDEVVAEYNILREIIHSTAEEHDITIAGECFQVLNRVLDQAIGTAVKSYATQRAIEVRQRREEHLSFVAHDLRNPLNAISMAASVLKFQIMGMDENTKVAQTVDTLVRNVQQVNAMVLQILHDNAELHAEVAPRLDRSRFELHPLIDEVVANLQPLLAGTNTQLVNDVPDDLKIDADRNLLMRVFINLASNAIKYTPDGRVTITAKSLEPDGIVECEVRDEGAGIREDFVEKIFEKLQTDPERAGGLGLGLAIVKQFVADHGGEIRVESVEGQGAAFRFTIPPSG